MRYSFPIFLAAAVGGLAVLHTAPTAARTPECGESYTVEQGDTLSEIAYEAFGDGRRWGDVYHANIRKIGKNPHLIRIGTELRIPAVESPRCSVETDSYAKALPDATGKEIRILTGGNYSPFTNRGRKDGGLISEIVNTALSQHEATRGRFGFAWESDWSKHLDPMLIEGSFDLGYPWLKPNCKENPKSFRCDNFHFSKPMFEMLVLLFVNKNQPLAFRKDSDIHGKTLCRPEGYYTHDLNQQGRNWVNADKIDLVRPASVDACFEKLANGDVDAVTVNEFTGRKAMHRVGVADIVKPIKTRPLSIQGLHVLVPKTHTNGRQLIEHVNAALANIRENGEYQDIVDKHLSNYWKQF